MAAFFQYHLVRIADTNAANIVLNVWDLFLDVNFNDPGSVCIRLDLTGDWIVHLHLDIRQLNFSGFLGT